jgi:hypothetical protein
MPTPNKANVHPTDTSNTDSLIGGKGEVCRLSTRKLRTLKIMVARDGISTPATILSGKFIGGGMPAEGKASGSRVKPNFQSERPV